MAQCQPSILIDEFLLAYSLFGLQKNIKTVIKGCHMSPVCNGLKQTHIKFISHLITVSICDKLNK